MLYTLAYLSFFLIQNKQVALPIGITAIVLVTILYLKTLPRYIRYINHRFGEVRHLKETFIQQLSAIHSYYDLISLNEESKFGIRRN
jgi:hypothetical protein